MYMIVVGIEIRCMARVHGFAVVCTKEGERLPNDGLSAHTEELQAFSGSQNGEDMERKGGVWPQILATLFIEGFENRCNLYSRSSLGTCLVSRSISKTRMELFRCMKFSLMKDFLGFVCVFDMNSKFFFLVYVKRLRYE